MTHLQDEGPSTSGCVLVVSRRATVVDSLTKSERSVAELVAEGLTNRAVGKRLFISPHTVNSHLRHSFQKLDVSTRAALAAKVSRAQSS